MKKCIICGDKIETTKGLKKDVCIHCIIKFVETLKALNKDITIIIK